MQQPVMLLTTGMASMASILTPGPVHESSLPFNPGKEHTLNMLSTPEGPEGTLAPRNFLTASNSKSKNMKISEEEGVNLEKEKEEGLLRFGSQMEVRN